MSPPKNISRSRHDSLIVRKAFQHSRSGLENAVAVSLTEFRCRRALRELRREQRIAIMDQIPLPNKQAIDGIALVPACETARAPDTLCKNRMVE